MQRVKWRQITTTLNTNSLPLLAPISQSISARCACARVFIWLCMPQVRNAALSQWPDNDSCCFHSQSNFSSSISSRLVSIHKKAITCMPFEFMSACTSWMRMPIAEKVFYFFLFCSIEPGQASNETTFATEMAKRLKSLELVPHRTQFDWGHFCVMSRV